MQKRKLAISFGFILLGFILPVTLSSCMNGIITPPVHTPYPDYPAYTPPPDSPPASPDQPQFVPAPTQPVADDTVFADMLVQQYGWSNTHVIRWPDGYVDVYDSTGYPRLQEVLNTWNDLIGGPTVFRLSTNPTSPVQVIYDAGLGVIGACGQAEIWLTPGGYAINQARVTINPLDAICPLQSTFLHEFGHVAGFGGHTSDGGVMDTFNTGSTTITETVRIMIRRLYELPVGMSWRGNLNSPLSFPIIGERVFEDVFWRQAWITLD